MCDNFIGPLHGVGSSNGYETIWLKCSDIYLVGVNKGEDKTNVGIIRGGGWDVKETPDEIFAMMDKLHHKPSSFTSYEGEGEKKGGCCGN